MEDKQMTGKHHTTSLHHITSHIHTGDQEVVWVLRCRAQSTLTRTAGPGKGIIRSSHDVGRIILRHGRHERILVSRATRRKTRNQLARQKRIESE